jgi:hypothetical protein
MHDCSSKRVLVLSDDGEYSSASDFNEDTLALLADDHAGNDNHPEEHILTGDANHYESLIVQRMLSTQSVSSVNWSKINDTHCFKQSVSSENGRVA